MEIDCFPLTRELSPVTWASQNVNRFLDYGMHNWCHDNESWSFLCSVSLFLFQLLPSLWRHPAGQKKKWKLLRKVNLVKPLTSFWILAFTKLQGFTESPKYILLWLLPAFAVTFASTMLNNLQIAVGFFMIKKKKQTSLTDKRVFETHFDSFAVGLWVT